MPAKFWDAILQNLVYWSVPFHQRWRSPKYINWVYFEQIMVKSTQFEQNWVLFFWEWYTDGWVQCKLCEKLVYRKSNFQCPAGTFIYKGKNTASGTCAFTFCTLVFFFCFVLFLFFFITEILFLFSYFLNSVSILHILTMPQVDVQAVLKCINDGGDALILLTWFFSTS